jgi:serine/threonine-protein kinase
VYGDIPRREINEQLTRILKSKLFKSSERLQRFLVFAVETTLSGKAHNLKEIVLAHIVFDRDESFDPQKDSIVRTEAKRLRQKLRAYYEGEGKEDPLVIGFTEGSYVPLFARGKPQRPPNWRTVAVLPFVNQSPGPKQDYFCDGISDDIIYALSQIPGLNVIARTSTHALRGRDAKEAGIRLGAGTVVGGSVRKSGSQVKIYAEMIDTATGEVRWAERFERPMNDVFVVEVEVAKAVARNLHARADVRRLIGNAPSMDAYTIFLRGRSAWDMANEEGYRRAAEIFEKAVDLFPTYASAHAGLSDAYVRLALWGYSRPLEVLPKAVRAAETAIELDPFSSHANATFAISKAWSEWGWKEGIATARKAVEFGPSDEYAQEVYGFTLLYGDAEDALASFERCVILDPYSVYSNRIYGYALYLARQFTNADQWLLAANAVQETSETNILLARSYLSQKRVHAAADLARQTLDHPTGLSVLGPCYAELNHREEALNILARLSKMAQVRWIQPRSFGRIHLALGDKDQAIEYLAKSLDEREPFSLFMKHDPEFDPLRGDPRFQELLAKLDQKEPVLA